MAAIPQDGGPGLISSVGRLSRSLLAHLRMRLQLIGLELEQEKERLFIGLAACLLTALFLTLTLVFFGVAIIVHYWDTPARETAVVLVASSALLLTLLSGAFAYARLMRPSRLFHASLAELLDDERAFLSEAVADSGLQDHDGSQ